MGLHSPYKRRWGVIAGGVMLFWLLVSSMRPAVPKSIHDMDTRITKSLYEASNRDAYGFYPEAESKRLCKTHNFASWPERNHRRKIYDLFMINTELDWLEIRLNELQEEVDFFVIVESPTTFTGLEKPLTLKNNWDRFARWHKQIIYHTLDMDGFWSTVTWDHEDHQRNAMFDQVFPSLAANATYAPAKGDVLLVSDVDEIPRRDTMTILRECVIPKRLTLRSQFYYYGFQWQHVGEQWAHPQATYFTTMEDTIRPADLRNGDWGWWEWLFHGSNKADLWNAAWHCSSCFSTLEETLNKMSSFSHTKWNQYKFREPQWIVGQVRHGGDLFNRTGEVYRRIDNNQDVPVHLKVIAQNDEHGGVFGQRFGYLVNRDPLNANFADVTLEDARTNLGQVEISQDQRAGT